jgi:hypothetical protein
MFGRKNPEPITGQRILKRQKFSPIHVVPGDSVMLTYHEPGKPERILVEETVTRMMTFDEGVVFEAEFEGRRATGGLFVEEAE